MGRCREKISLDIVNGLSTKSQGERVKRAVRISSVRIFFILFIAVCRVILATAGKVILFFLLITSSGHIFSHYLRVFSETNPTANLAELLISFGQVNTSLS
jgi:hypothetical protein